MLLRNRPPRLDAAPATPAKGLEHLPDTAISVLRWLNANRVDYVLVGAVARSIRGETASSGPVSIVPAPYGRNLDRLARALWSGRARVRVPATSSAGDTAPVKMTAEKLVRAASWSLRCGAHDLDIEGRPDGVPRYQELLYEATRLEIAPGIMVEVAAPEDIEHYDHVRRTGTVPEIKITRATREPRPL